MTTTVGVLHGEAVDACVTAATAAPSIHNTQPWLFRVHDPVIEVHADIRRRLPRLDPQGRQLAMSVGAATLNLRVALRARGRLPVQHILPIAALPALLAVVRPGPFSPPDDSVLALARAIPRRHTSRIPFMNSAIPWRVQQDLAAAAAAEGAALTFCDPVTRDGILAMTRAAEQTLSRDPAYRDEIAQWTGREARCHDGIPESALGVQDADHRLALRDFRLGRTDPPGRRTARFERQPALAVLSTRDDTCYDWVRAGQALQRVLLTATVHGLVGTPMNQTLEVPALRRLVGVEGAGSHAQAILRLGHGRPGPATPRRGSADVLIHDE